MHSIPICPESSIFSYLLSIALCCILSYLPQPVPSVAVRCLLSHSPQSVVSAAACLTRRSSSRPVSLAVSRRSPSYPPQPASLVTIRRVHRGPDGKSSCAFQKPAAFPHRSVLSCAPRIVPESRFKNSIRCFKESQTCYNNRRAIKRRKNCRLQRHGISGVCYNFFLLPRRSALRRGAGGINVKENL